MIRSSSLCGSLLHILLFILLSFLGLKSFSDEGEEEKRRMHISLLHISLMYFIVFSLINLLVFFMANYNHTSVKRLPHQHILVKI
jgi:heme/copper-type cytochrome/quinol oxidase subunit 2